MENFWDNSVWGGCMLMAMLLISVFVSHALKRMIKPLKSSLIPAPVLGGLILLITAFIFKLCTGYEMFDTAFFGGNGYEILEIITYHTLALGFIGTTFKSSGLDPSKKRVKDIFNTGVTTVSTYLLQGMFGLAITIGYAYVTASFFPAAGILLPFGYGQGTGQALNYGGIFENTFGFTGGKSFGLSIAALGFLSASLGGVVHLDLLRRRGKVEIKKGVENAIRSEEIQGNNEVPMQESMDKFTIQCAFIAAAYLFTYLFMSMLGLLLPGMRSVIFGFNFLIGVLVASVLKFVMNVLNKRNIVHRTYINSFLMTRVSNFCFDVMVVAGIAAIRLHVIRNYWAIMLVLGVVGLIITFIYNRIVARSLFPDYCEEQFLMMYGMLTGTASTGIILLREIDSDFSTPVSDNMVYQNFPAIVFGFPLMLLATMAPEAPVKTLIIIIAFFAVMNLILFRSKLFRAITGTSRH
ncbi:MAG: hypothetical protein IKP31_02985 [Lachnospiraceae bacterium]|nr:hypothetical protein [Lachnospiraceae bacterium]